MTAISTERDMDGVADAVAGLKGDAEGRRRGFGLLHRAEGRDHVRGRRGKEAR